MTAIRNKPLKSYHAFLVRPVAGFSPIDWRSKPSSYQIIEYVGAKEFEGRADAWRFQHNYQAIRSGTTDCWAIWVE